MGYKNTMNETDALLTPKQIEQVFTLFEEQDPSPKTELNYINPFTLLVSVLLSAQATDKSVNKATEALYKIASTPQQMLQLGEAKLIDYIKSIGLYRTKAAHVIATSQMLIEKFNGEVPCTREELMMLPGVGRKTANVVLNVVFGQNTMPVDTHLLRISPRIGLSNGTTPEQVESDLCKCIPQKFMQHAHHWLILHGRYICTARKPKCDECCIEGICKKRGVK